MKPRNLLAFLLAHVALALWMDDHPEVSTAHALAVLAVSLWWFLVSDSVPRMAGAAAYIMGAEVLWRMTEARVFWETAKFAIAGLFLIAVLRRRRKRIPGLAVLYFALLAPAAVLTLRATTMVEAREHLSFNLSGPLTLTMSVLFFYGMGLTAQQFQRLLLIPLGPLAGVAGIALSRTLRAGFIEFIQESNVVLSGGFGPNQVSAMLGLGAFLAMFFLLQDGLRLTHRLAAFVVMSILLIQSVLTFSRGGVMGAAGAAALATFYLVRDRRIRGRILQLAPVMVAVSVYWVIPRLDAFTGGALRQRYQDADLGQRASLLREELRIWKANPIFGVGPGMATLEQPSSRISIAAHTEFSRALAEHGLMGLGALLALALLAVQRFQTARSPAAKAMVVSMFGWSFLYMVHSAMRLAAPGFLFGLAFANPVFRWPAPALIEAETGAGAAVTSARATSRPAEEVPS